MWDRIGDRWERKLLIILSPKQPHNHKGEKREDIKSIKTKIKIKLKEDYKTNPLILTKEKILNN